MIKRKRVQEEKGQTKEDIIKAKEANKPHQSSRKSRREPRRYHRQDFSKIGSPTHKLILGDLQAPRLTQHQHLRDMPSPFIFTGTCKNEIVEYFGLWM
jgi:hypothetical protein